jgi:anthranilate synthase/aminodeoxychorismate synthase-like glutamine amidotransferase
VVLVIDNYDSFTYNLVQCLGEMGCRLVVLRNDAVSLGEIADMGPERIVISPGPGTPDDAGICADAIRRFSPQVPILGVCLGHQAIGQVFGGRVVRNVRIVHGKTSWIHHDGRGVFLDCANPFEATRYHSLVVQRDTVPECLEVSAWTDEGEVMGLRHRAWPTEGVQFHPESIMTHEGKRILRNFLALPAPG